MHRAINCWKVILACAVDIFISLLLIFIWHSQEHYSCVPCPLFLNAICPAYRRLQGQDSGQWWSSQGSCLWSTQETLCGHRRRPRSAVEHSIAMIPCGAVSFHLYAPERHKRDNGRPTYSCCHTWLLEHPQGSTQATSGGISDQSMIPYKPSNPNT